MASSPDVVSVLQSRPLGCTPSRTGSPATVVAARGPREADTAPYARANRSRAERWPHVRRWARRSSLACRSSGHRSRSATACELTAPETHVCKSVTERCPSAFSCSRHHLSRRLSKQRRMGRATQHQVLARKPGSRALDEAVGKHSGGMPGARGHRGYASHVGLPPDDSVGWPDVGAGQAPVASFGMSHDKTPTPLVPPRLALQSARVDVSSRVVRLLGPDLARGMLLLLIASANVWGYLWSEEGYNEAGGRPVGGSSFDHFVDGVLTLLVDSHTKPMFAILYGARRCAERSTGRGGVLTSVVRTRSRATLRSRSACLTVSPYLCGRTCGRTDLRRDVAVDDVAPRGVIQHPFGPGFVRAACTGRSGRAPGDPAASSRRRWPAAAPRPLRRWLSRSGRAATTRRWKVSRQTRGPGCPVRATDWPPRRRSRGESGRWRLAGWPR